VGQGGLGVSTGEHRPGALCDERKTTVTSHDPNTLINGYHVLSGRVMCKGSESRYAGAGAWVNNVAIGTYTPDGFNPVL